MHRAANFDFVARLGAEVEKLSFGPAAEGAAIGPLITAAAVDRVRRSVERAVAEGARISHQAPLPDAPGHFFAPTVLAGGSPDATILREEIFGPVAPVVVWHDEEELLRLVNDTEYGLAVRLRRRPRPRRPPRRADRRRHDRHQPRAGLRPSRSLWWEIELSQRVSARS